MDLRLTLLLALGAACVLAAPGSWEEDYVDSEDSDHSAEPVGGVADAREQSRISAGARDLGFRREPATFSTYERLMERRQARVLANIGGGTVPLGTVSWKPAKSCKAIKANRQVLPSGIYYIYFKKGNLVQVFRTYCQMTIDGGAWTFIPRQAVIKGTENQGLIDQLFTDKKEVLLVIHQPGRQKKQRFTRIRQIGDYSHVDLSLTVNDHDASPRPASFDMGPYLYLRVLPPSISEKNTMLGFQVNGHNAMYRNCKARRSNYWALYPNDNNHEPLKKFNKHCNTQPCVTWITHGVSMYGPQEVPNDMLFYAEMHFGQQGCGIEQVSGGTFQDYSLGVAVR